MHSSSSSDLGLPEAKIEPGSNTYTGRLRRDGHVGQGVGTDGLYVPWRYVLPVCHVTLDNDDRDVAELAEMRKPREIIITLVGVNLFVLRGQVYLCFHIASAAHSLESALKGYNRILALNAWSIRVQGRSTTSDRPIFLLQKTRNKLLKRIRRLAKTTWWM